MKLRICGAALVAVVALGVWHSAGAGSREAGTSATQAVDSRLVTDNAGLTSQLAVPAPPISETSLVVHADLEDQQDVGITRFAGIEGQVVSVTVRSPAFEPRVMLLSTDGELLAEDPGRLAAILPGTGDYVVEVIAANHQPGPYELTVEVQRQLEQLAFDAPVHGYLADETDVAGWRFAGSKGQLVSVTAHSVVFNPQVAILFADGERLAWDYDGGPGSDSHLVATLPATGNYVLDVAAVDGNSGPYELELRAVRVEPLGLDTPVEGRLVGGAAAVGWHFTGAAGQVFSVTAHSDAFSPRLVLLGGDSEEVARSRGPRRADLSAPLPGDGRYTIVLTSEDAASGPYEIELSSPTLFSEGFWRFRGAAGQTVSIAVRSEHFHPRVELVSPGGEVLAWSNGDRVPAHLVARLPRPGDYTIRITPIRIYVADPWRGPYNLTLRTVEEELALDTAARSRLDTAAEVAGRSFAANGDELEVEELALGTSVHAWFDAERASRFWRLAGVAGQVLRVSARSAFYPRVSLLFPDGDARYAEEYNTGGDSLSQMILPLPRTGDYLLRVESLYGEPGSGEVLARTVEVEDLGPDLSGTGVLDPATEEDVWRFPGVEGQVVSVVAHSDAFNPRVALLSPDGEELAWDVSSGPGTDPLLVAALPHTGEYVVVVSLLEGDAGPYEVAVREAEVERLVPGSTAAGRLEEGREFGLWGFSGVEGQMLRVTASSDAFNPRLVFVSPDGERVDWLPYLEEWPLMATLSHSGRHLISVTAVDDKPGPYEVTVRPVRVEQLAVGEAVDRFLRPDNAGR